MVDNKVCALTRQLSGRGRPQAAPVKIPGRLSPPEDLLVADSGDLGERKIVRDPLPTVTELPLAQTKRASKSADAPVRTTFFYEDFDLRDVIEQPCITSKASLQVAAARLKLRSACTILVPLVDEDALGARTLDQIEVALMALSDALRCLPGSRLKTFLPQTPQHDACQNVSGR